MVSVTDISAALGSLKVAGDMAKALYTLSTDAKIKLATMDLMKEIYAAHGNALEAQQAQTALLRENGELKEEISQMKKWDAEKMNYDFKAIDDGAFAYMLKPAKRGKTPAHWLCANCFDNGHRSTLQLARNISHNHRTTPTWSAWACPRCKAEIMVTYGQAPFSV